MRAIGLFDEKQDQDKYDDRTTDLHLWSFTNSGTGAACEIDRIPNRFFRKLLVLYAKTDCRPELERILSSDWTNTFLDCLANDSDWQGLYKTKNQDGVSVAFFEAYQKLIGRAELLNYARYAAALMHNQTFGKTETKLLEKTDAHSEAGYETFFQKMLIEAAARGEWSLEHHLRILDNSDGLPIWSSVKGVFKKVHFYFQKAKSGDWKPEAVLPTLQNGFEGSTVGQVCAFAIRLINTDERADRHAKQLADAQKFEDFILFPLLLRQAGEAKLEQIATCFSYKNSWRHDGLTQLLRIYFSTEKPSEPPATELPKTDEKDEWLNRLGAFADFYRNYYLEKYEGDLAKFHKHVLRPFPKKASDFWHWLMEACERMRVFYAEKDESKPEIETFENGLCYDSEGQFNPAFARWAIAFSLHQKHQTEIISSTI